FFQAEDGIRDFHVTGVQTCALPISQYEPFNKLHQVQYVDSPPKVDANKIFSDTEDQTELVGAFLATKYKDWGHEKEWRVVHLERSEERRVGKECRYRWSLCGGKKKW